ncbi:Mob1/phocein [Syncephalis fuscata]|nr:Mob1/phocein [Syncephalis fuscata]
MAFMSTPNIIQRNCRNDSATGHPVPMPTQLSGELTLGLDCLKKVVKLPAGEKQCEWIAVHVVDFFNQVNLLYGTITEFCTPRDCPVMSAGDRYQYRWLENKQSSRHSTCLSSKSVTTITSASTYTNSDCGSGYYSGSLANRREGASRAILLPAPDYIDNIMRWGLRMIENLQTLQDQKSASFTQMSSSVVRTLFKRIFRIYAHIYHAHSGAISVLRQEALLNTSFIHFVLFAREFNLIDEREEHPMAEVIALLTNPRMQQR